MKHAQTSSQSMVSISDAAMDRARRAMSKVAYSSAKTQQITRAAQKLPDVAVMAGRKRASGTTATVRKLSASV